MTLTCSKNLTYLLHRAWGAVLIETDDTKSTYWFSLFLLSGSMRRRVSLITATFTSSSTRLGTFSNTPGESLNGKNSMLQWRDSGIQYQVTVSTQWSSLLMLTRQEYFKGSLYMTLKKCQFPLTN